MTEQTPNPFDALGGGGFDMNALLQQAQQMQERLEDAQAQLADTTVEGTVGGGVVTVTVNGVGELVGVAIREGGFDGGSADDLANAIRLVPNDGWHDGGRRRHRAVPRG